MLGLVEFLEEPVSCRPVLLSMVSGGDWMLAGQRLKKIKTAPIDPHALRFGARPGKEDAGQGPGGQRQRHPPPGPNGQHEHRQREGEQRRQKHAGMEKIAPDARDVEAIEHTAKRRSGSQSGRALLVLIPEPTKHGQLGCDQNDHRKPQLVWHLEVLEVAPTSTPGGPRCLLGQGRVRHQAGKVTHAKNLVPQRHEHRGRQQHDSATPALLKRQEDRPEEQGEDAQVGTNQRAKPQPQARQELESPAPISGAHQHGE